MAAPATATKKKKGSWGALKAENERLRADVAALEAANGALTQRCSILDGQRTATDAQVLELELVNAEENVRRIQAEEELEAALDAARRTAAADDGVAPAAAAAADDGAAAATATDDEGAAAAGEARAAERVREAEETFEAARRGWAAEKRELERRLAASPEFRVVEQEESRSSGEDKKLEALVRLRTAELQEARKGVLDAKWHASVLERKLDARAAAERANELDVSRALASERARVDLLRDTLGRYHRAGGVERDRCLGALGRLLGVEAPRPTTPCAAFSSAGPAVAVAVDRAAYAVRRLLAAGSSKKEAAATL